MKEASWISCPVCHGKTRIKVRRDTIISKLPLYCPKCKQETLVNITNAKLTIIEEPDAKTQSR
ncbi:cysteine-rich KTR domain-containing protein [Enterococcus sp. 669A]|uniref:Cysteine-rich KTR domain-containing protein n=1 Tax=Candidatus Enterococcus moelleringii TaxID=2815325 RepID=A0ABS3LB66_9ENTE|nr:cysteine-rich KTR domain-containing protein [Enterococcus sp. 669A]MBO1306861.1 cysteine-rich KTR domain-containing protein [Enterococcus sp. 669A]